MTIPKRKANSSSSTSQKTIGSQSSQTQGTSQTTSESSSTQTSDGYSERVVNPEVTAGADRVFQNRMRLGGYVQDPNSPTGYSKDKTLYDALGVNRDNLREERERQQRINENKKKAAALFNSGAILSDMISAGIGGNVWRRDKDTTIADADKDNERLRELQAAEDAAAAEKERQDYLATMREALNARDNYIRDFSRQVSHSEGRSEGKQSSNTTSSSSSSGTSRSSTNSQTSSYVPVSGSGSGSGSSSSSSSSNREGKGNILYINGKWYEIPQNAWKGSTARQLYNNLRKNGYITDKQIKETTGDVKKEPSFEQMETLVNNTIYRLETEGGVNNQGFKWEQVRGDVLVPAGRDVGLPGGRVIQDTYYGNTAPYLQNNNQAPYLHE